MVFATGGSHLLTYIQESTFGTTPTPTAASPMRKFRLTQNSIIAVRDSFTSEELRGDQQVSDLRLGAKGVAGDLNFEMSYLGFDDFIEAALGGTWAPTFTDTDVDWSATAATNTFTQGAGTDLTTVLSANDYVRVSGFTGDVANNGIFKVATVAPNSFTVTPTGTLVDDAAGESVTVEALTGAVLKSGLSQPSFTFENQYNDQGFDVNSKYLVYEGMTTNTFNLSLSPNGIVTGSFGLIGEAPRASAFSNISLGATFEDSVVNPSANFSPMDSFSGQVDEGATIDIMTITGIELALTRNLNPEFVIGKDQTVRITPGRNVVTGTVTAFFENKTLLEKFLNETSSSLKFTMLDTSSNTVEVFLPNIKYTAGDNSVSGEAAILVSMPFTALYDATEATNIRITR